MAEISSSAERPGQERMGGLQVVETEVTLRPQFAKKQP
jgi:hypothetical protein